MNAQKTSLVSVMEFHGSPIAFQEVGGKMMVNATQMAKPFGKRTRDWLRLEQAQDLIHTVSEAQMCASADLQQVRRGGNFQGTWFQEDVALFFAQWLSPKFYLACNRKLKELLSQQVIATATPEKYGINGILSNGEALYPYKESCNILGGVKWPKAYRRKKVHPQHFRLVYGRNFVTETYLTLLKGFYDYKNAANQLKLGL